MKIHYLCAFMALVLPLCCSPALAGEAHQACETPPVLRHYAELGRLQQMPDGRLALQLVADLHAADCGAPDCYGTNLNISMKLQKRGKACVLRDVLVSTSEFFGQGCADAAGADHSRQESYATKGKPVDLADPRLKKLTLHNKSGRRAIVLLPDNFFYFPKVVPGGVLHTHLPSDEDDEKSCCWGSSSANVSLMKAAD